MQHPSPWPWIWACLLLWLDPLWAQTLVPATSSSAAALAPIPTPPTALTHALQRHAAPKHALVIGNSQYQGFHRALKNPARDAQLIAQTLTQLGFEVHTALDVTREQMSAKVSRFAQQLPPGATSVVFYAGHGVQIGGASYLMPVDISLGSEQGVRQRAYPLRRLLDEVSATSSAVNIVIVDACRDNPFQPPPPVRYRSNGPMGLAKVQAPRGTLVAYSTQPGQLAADGAGTHSVYAQALAKTLLEPGVTLEDLFKKVNTLVRNATQDDQIPWYESSLTQTYFLLPPQGITVVGGLGLRISTTPPTNNPLQRGSNPDELTPPLLWFLGMQAHELAKLEYDIDRIEETLNTNEVAKWTQLAEGGNVVAMTVLGHLYRHGNTNKHNANMGATELVAVDNAKAFYWFEKAAQQGFPLAQFELALMFKVGSGTAPDQAKTRELLAKASKARFRRAEMALLELNVFDTKNPSNELLPLEN